MSVSWFSMAVHAGGHSTASSRLIFYVVSALVIAAVAFQVRRKRSRGESVSPFDGKGPAVNWFPHAMRPWVNRLFMKRGWPAPYDEQGRKIPRAQRGGR